MSETLTRDTLPTSFGTFKPVGHVMLGLATIKAVEALEAALRQAGWPEDALLRFLPGDSVKELTAMIDAASGAAGFGYEITLLRRYLGLAEVGVRWLLVRVDGTESAARVAELGRAQGAMLAVHYRLLTVEDLI